MPPIFPPQKQQMPQGGAPAPAAAAPPPPAPASPAPPQGQPPAQGGGVTNFNPEVQKLLFARLQAIGGQNMNFGEALEAISPQAAQELITLIPELKPIYDILMQQGGQPAGGGQPPMAGGQPPMAGGAAPPPAAAGAPPDGGDGTVYEEEDDEEEESDNPLAGKNASRGLIG